MRYYVYDDPFKDNQPPKSFIADLTRPMHTDVPVCWNKREAAENEIKINALKLGFDFPDEEGLLETSYDDFKAFMKIAGIKESEDGLPLELVYGETVCREAYRIEVSKEKVTVTAADTEGIRRALIYIEDEMGRREGTFLALGTTERHPFVRTRISRCFYAPPSHNDNFGMIHELDDEETDYYPEAYLNRLMHDGVNGLWIGANFRDLLESDVVPGYGEGGEKRLIKLRGIIERCRRYGIGIYLFSVEPASTYRNPVLEKRTELHGGTAWGSLRLFCSSTDEFKAYIRESVTRLFEALPKLAGFINITSGECLSGCGSGAVLNCPRCKEKYGTLAAALTATEKMFADIMKEVAPEAEFISWTYAQRGWKDEELNESLKLRDPSVIHMQNFEDHGIQMQLGRKRTLYDYWLAYVGPGTIMDDSTKINKQRGVKTYAKLQICTSFDFSTVPYVPAPGILFDKFSYMHDNGISGALMCWYFGNYPGVMNKAACELAFEPYFSDKRSFLENLAAIWWGKDAKKIADAWELFEESYKNIPLNRSFEWFSPMSDSPAVPLHLKPIDMPMPGVWKKTEMVGSDRIGEALLDGHSIEEAEILTGIMRDKWNEGMSIFTTADIKNTKSVRDQQIIAETLKILIESGNNIVRFYALRRKLGIGTGDNAAILDSMEAIAREEIENSRKLIPLCDEAPYLGYMSEANGFKFFREKLLWRIDLVEKCIDEEFAEVRERISKGLPPLTFYRGEEEGARVCRVHKGKIEDAEPLYFLDKDGKETDLTYVAAACENDNVTLRFTMKDSSGDRLGVSPEFRMFHPSAPFSIGAGKVIFSESAGYNFSDVVMEERINAVKCEFERTEDGTDIYTLKFTRESMHMDSCEPFRLSVGRSGKHSHVLGLTDRTYSRLVMGIISPDSYAFFVE